MRMLTLQLRSLTFHRRMHLSVGLAVATASAVITGALVVGDSMRGSMRDAALRRLGPVHAVITSPRFFPADLADRLLAYPDVAELALEIAPIILMPGAATHAEKQTRAGDVTVVGGDERLWRWFGDEGPGSLLGPRRTTLNDALATELRALPGEDVLLRMGRPTAISTETLLGRRDRSTAALRVTATPPVSAGGMGGFSLNLRQTTSRNAFVSLSDLQSALDQPGRANALLIAVQEIAPRATPGGAIEAALKAALRSVASLGDYGLTLRRDVGRGYDSLEADSILIDPVVETNVVGMGKANGQGPALILSYLANKLTVDPSREESRLVPYSTVVGVSEGDGVWDELRDLNDEPIAFPPPDGIVLNDWTARELAARIGDRVTIEYYVSQPGGALRTDTHAFLVADIARLDGVAADPGFVPPYPGVTDTENLADWDAPFPMDLSLVQTEDELYWKDHRTTPKAFLRLDDAQRLWATSEPQFGRLTSIRFPLEKNAANPTSVEQDIGVGLLARIDPSSVGLSVSPIRASAIAAATGSTDFGVLFLSFSFFIIGSAALLVALMYRLGVERRVFELGLLSAVGFSPKQTARVLLAEGAITSALGALLGLAAAGGYASLMLGGLRTWWADAVRAPFLTLHVETRSLGIGAGVTVVVAMVSVAFALRGLASIPTRMLLAGTLGDSPGQSRGRARRWGLSGVGAGLAAITLAAAGLAGALPPVAAFFGSGVAALVAGLMGYSRWLRRMSDGLDGNGVARSLPALAIRNASRHPGRALLTVSLIASASFLVVSLEAYRMSPDGAELTRDRNSGAGGFSLWAESATPLPYDLLTEAGRRDMGLSSTTGDAIAQGELAAFRLRPGDHTSCQNLYQSSQPRILGANDQFIDRGGFRFASSLASPEGEAGNPWTLLRRELHDGSIPVIGDEAAVVWQLKSGLNKTFTIADGRGQPVVLRFVALLKGSCLQDELIVHEQAFRRMYPGVSGPSFFLFRPSDGSEAPALESALERELTRFGLDVRRTDERIAGYQAVQNTYLSTFQALGGLGLALGTVGLGAVLFRNVWERRKELGLMTALGFSPGALKRLVLIESVSQLSAGLLVGGGAASLAIVPRLLDEPGSIPIASLVTTFAAITVIAIGACVVAVGRALATPPLSALRSE